MANPAKHWSEELIYSIDEWSDDGVRLIEVHARISTLFAATAAYWAMLQARPKAWLTLRQGSSVLGERKAVGPAG